MKRFGSVLLAFAVALCMLPYANMNVKADEIDEAAPFEESTEITDSTEIEESTEVGEPVEEPTVSVENEDSNETCAITVEAASPTATKSTPSAELIAKLKSIEIGYDGPVLQFDVTGEIDGNYTPLLWYTEEERGGVNPTKWSVFRVTDNLEMIYATEIYPVYNAQNEMPCSPTITEVGTYIVTTQDLQSVDKILYGTSWDDPIYIQYTGSISECGPSIMATVDLDRADLNTAISVLCSADMAPYLAASNWSWIGFDVKDAQSISSSAIQTLGKAGYTRAVVEVGLTYETGQFYYFEFSISPTSWKAMAPTVSTQENAVITQKLRDAGYTGSMYHITFGGSMPGACYYVQDDITESIVPTDLNYVYEYDPITEKFQRIYGSVGTGEIWIQGIRQGYYVAVESALPASLTGGNSEIRDFTDNYYSDEYVAATLVSAINSATSDTTMVSATVGANTSINSDVFEAAKTAGVGLAISTYDGNVTWGFSSITSSATFDPSVTTGSNSASTQFAAVMAENAEAGEIYAEAAPNMLGITFAYHGDLPGSAEVRLDLSAAGYADGTTVYYYYYDPETKTYTYIDESVVKNNNGIFTMTHCSEYVVSDVDDGNGSIIYGSVLTATQDSADLAINEDGSLSLTLTDIKKMNETEIYLTSINSQIAFTVSIFSKTLYEENTDNVMAICDWQDLGDGVFAFSIGNRFAERELKAIRLCTIEYAGGCLIILLFYILFSISIKRKVFEKKKDKVWYIIRQILFFDFVDCGLITTSGTGLFMSELSECINGTADFSHECRYGWGKLVSFF